MQNRKFNWKVYPLAVLTVGVLVLLGLGEREFPCGRCNSAMQVSRTPQFNTSGDVIGTRLDYKCPACGAEEYEFVLDAAGTDIGDVFAAKQQVATTHTGELPRWMRGVSRAR